MSIDVSFCLHPVIMSLFFFFNDTATTEIYTLSLHDALPIFDLLADDREEDFEHAAGFSIACLVNCGKKAEQCVAVECQDRKSTRLNSSHLVISYAVFCLKKKNTSYHSCPTSMGL